MSNNIEKTLERIEALPPHKTVWTNRCHEGGEYQSDVQPFDTSDLWQLAASYREMAKTVERYERMIAKADLMDFEGDFCIQQWNEGFIGTRYDEDGAVLQQVKATTALAAFEAIEGEQQ